MKTYFFIFSLVILLFSCSSPERKAKKAIKEDLKLTMHDYKSYEPVQFGKLEVAMSNWEDVPEVKVYLAKADEFLKQYKEYDDKADIYHIDYSNSTYLMYSKIANDYLALAKLYNEKADSIRLHFVPEVIGWQMTHSFRAKSLGGNFGIHQYLFVMNKDLTKVIKSIDLSEE
jgi:hypothetical protein